MLKTRFEFVHGFVTVTIIIILYITHQHIGVV